MKSFTSLLVVLCVLLHHASAHYIFWQFTYGGTKYPTYTYVRKNTNMNSPVTDLASNDLRCNAGGESGAATDTLAVKAGGEFTWTSDTAVYHNGATAMYMAKAPTTAKEYDGSGQRWFKIVEIGPTFSGGNPTWPLWQTYTYRIPPATPNGEYLLRIEQLALHNPGGVPQFYISCAQVSVSNGGSGTPGPLVSIPGYVKGTETGYTVNIYNNFKSYSLVGPSVWAGQNDTSPPVVVPSTTSKPPPTSTPTPVIVPTPTPSPVIVPSPSASSTSTSTSTSITVPVPPAQVTLISTVYTTKWNTSFVFFTATSTATVISPSILTTTATLTSSCAAGSVQTITQNLGGVTVTATAPALTIVSTASASALPAATITIISTTTAPALTLVSTSPPTTTTLTITAPDAGKTVTITSLSLFTITTYDTITETSTYTEYSTVTVGSGEVGSPNNGGGGAAGTIALWSQCGGKDWNGSGTCVAGATCKYSNEFYSQCMAS